MACKGKNVCKACGQEDRSNSDNPFYSTNQLYIPATAMLAEAEDGLLLATVQVYSPPSSHSQSVGILCSGWVIYTSLGSFSDDSGGVSGSRYSGGRSTSRDTGEDWLHCGQSVLSILLW